MKVPDAFVGYRHLLAPNGPLLCGSEAFEGLPALSSKKGLTDY